MGQLFSAHLSFLTFKFYRWIREIKSRGSETSPPQMLVATTALPLLVPLNPSWQHIPLLCPGAAAGPVGLPPPAAEVNQLSGLNEGTPCKLGSLCQLSARASHGSLPIGRMSALNFHLAIYMSAPRSSSPSSPAHVVQSMAQSIYARYLI